MHDAYIFLQEQSNTVADGELMDHTTNLLGAITLALMDRIEGQMQQALNRSGEAPAALIFLGYIPGLSIEVLRQVLQLSHPGTVRLIDRLEKDSLVVRQKTDDGRAVALFLTEKGKRLRSRLMKQRLNVLESTLEVLNTEERRIFGELLAKVLENIPQSETDKHHICRHCSVKLCGEHCPIPGNAPILEPYRKRKTHGK